MGKQLVSPPPPPTPTPHPHPPPHPTPHPPPPPPTPQKTKKRKKNICYLFVYLMVSANQWRCYLCIICHWVRPLTFWFDNNDIFLILGNMVVISWQKSGHLQSGLVTVRWSNYVHIKAAAIMESLFTRQCALSLHGELIIRHYLHFHIRKI